MFAELEALRGAATEEAKSRRKDVADQVTIELVRHSVAEEVLVYPQVDKRVSTEEAEHARKEHAEAEETLARMEKLDAEDPAFDDALGPAASLFDRMRDLATGRGTRRLRRRAPAVSVRRRAYTRHISANGPNPAEPWLLVSASSAGAPDFLRVATWRRPSPSTSSPTCSRCSATPTTRSSPP